MPYLTLHGHFYQPPRENPWTEEIDREPSAEPFHDWNERISEECYRANAYARVLADDARVVDILNNYAYLSFNFGPTLLAWLRARAPDVYERIRQGDALSRARLGHGNAIAQVYNHVILPLANRRDKVTQVRWGLADFRYHFGREAEAVWLAETAVDGETLEVLAQAGMRYVVLAPTQAARVRPHGSPNHAGWQEVGDGSIDPSRAYVCRLASGRSLAVFFYDGRLAHGASFGDTLASAQGFVADLAGAVDPRRARAQLIHFAVDGETFGHHKSAAERTLIYAFTHEAPAHGFAVTNYAAYLDHAPPEWEVEIKPETAWSCAHGLGRWSRDCGCRAGGEPGWHQRWRAPLRAALDHLRDSLATIYAREAPALLGDPWEARDAWGDVLPDRAPDRIESFLAGRAGRTLTPEERERALTLLEMQRHALFMYTSCGWFFSELSGLETVQVLKYAARAIDLASRFNGARLTQDLLADLERAESNDARYQNGAHVHRQLVMPTAIGPERVAASYTLNALVKAFPVRHRRHAYLIEQIESHSRQVGEYRLVCAQLRLTSHFTSRQSQWTCAALHLGGYNFAASVLPCDDESRCRALCSQLADYLKPSSSIPSLLRLLKAVVGPNTFGLGDLPPSDRRRILQHLETEVLANLSSSYEQIYAQHLGTIHALRQARMPVPPELRLAAEYTLSHRLERAAGDLARHADEASEAAMAQVIRLAQRDDLRLERGWAAQTLRRAVIEAMQAIVNTPSAEARPEPYVRLGRLLEAANRLGFDLRPPRAQEMLLDHLRAHAARPWPPHAREAAIGLAEQLGLSSQVVQLPAQPD